MTSYLSDIDIARGKARRAAVSAANAADRFAKAFKAVSKVRGVSSADAGVFNAVAALGAASHDAFSVAAKVGDPFWHPSRITEQDAAVFDGLVVAADSVGGHVGFSYDAVKFAKAASSVANEASKVAAKAERAFISANYPVEMRDNVSGNNAVDAIKGARESSRFCFSAMNPPERDAVLVAKAAVAAARAGNAASAAKCAAKVATATIYTAVDARTVDATIAAEAADKVVNLSATVVLAAKFAICAAVAAKPAVRKAAETAGADVDIACKAANGLEVAIVDAVFAAFEVVRAVALASNFYDLDAAAQTVVKAAIVTVEHAQSAHIAVKSDDTSCGESARINALEAACATYAVFKAADPVVFDVADAAFVAIKPLPTAACNNFASAVVHASASTVVAAAVIKSESVQGGNRLCNAFVGAAETMALAAIANTDDPSIKTVASALVPLFANVAVKEESDLF